MASIARREPPAFELFVSTLPGHPDVGLLQSAARAGATAILDLEGIRERADVEAAVTALARSKPGRIGLRIDSASSLELLPPSALTSFDVVVLRPDVLSRADFFIPFRAAGRTLLVECTTIGDAVAAAQAGADGVIAKGHEAGGRVGEETTFVLVQRLLGEAALPVIAHGGIGLHSAAACYAAGCAGVVLDAQVLLARESSLPDSIKAAIERLGGDETVCLGGELGERYRVYRRPGLLALQSLQRLESELSLDPAPEDERRQRWRAAIREAVNWRLDGPPLWPIGQDAAMASELSKRFRSIAGILSGLRDAIASHVESACDLRPLDEGSPLALSHGTRYPILQGPMTRVSDVAGFAAAVAEGGGLPFLALALLRGPQVRTLLEETQQLVGNRPWGVGILGFVPLELRAEQLAIIEEFAPPFAIIAGGRPDQAASLERRGIATYLHVPAPSLLKMFLGDGARRFIFEGRECGGHVGPRTSFVLWELAIAALADAVKNGVKAEELHVVFAGGIHDARSAAMVAAMSAPLAKLGVRVGVLIGTGYLFTEEAVAAGAIVETFQQEALRCTGTVLLESGPGHATRCADTPFYDTFRETRRRLLAEGKSGDDTRTELETLNLGRLRIASKGVARGDHSSGQAGPTPYVPVTADDQRRDGMYMIGQVAALRGHVCRIADLHADVSTGATEWLRGVARPAAPHVSRATACATSARVAIVGMGCLLPQAHDIRALWRNIINRRDAITEVPRDRFDIDRYYSTDRKARDRVYSRWGGFLEEVPFDPIKYGIPPGALPSIDPFQLLTLEVVHQALNDAGYADRPFDRERTSVILGASGGVGDLGFHYGIRAGLPMYFDNVPEETLSRLPEWTEDSFAGVLLNVASGRVANRLDLGGLNFTVDAACASSLAAIFIAVRELETGSSNVAIVGGIDTVNSPFGYLCFSSAQALSPRGRCRTFDEGADGIAISEGLVSLVLKRLPDAERDGDRIYAVIRSAAGSSDGRGKGMTAPRPEGQARVLERAYAAAEISPATVGLIEAHGTGTVAGDGAELSALSRVFTAAGAGPQSCAVGSIKSMIGHTKSAAGVSGVAKVALSLYHKVLPPTLHVTNPNPKLREPGTPLFVNTEAQPWIAPSSGEPRRAGVSSFGFGGTNFHVVVEEYDRQAAGSDPLAAPVDLWPAELAVWAADTPDDLIRELDKAERILTGAGAAPLASVAAAICREHSTKSSAALRLAVVASDVEDLRTKIRIAGDALSSGRTELADPRGVYLGPIPATPPKIAFLFPGQGSQYPGMHRDLALHFAVLRQALELADHATAGMYPRRLSSYVFPPPAFGKPQEQEQLRDLTDTVVAQPALGAVEVGLCRLLQRLGIRPDFAAGHSYGEYAALWCADVFPTETLFALSAERGRLIKRAAGDAGGTMAAVVAAPEAIERVVSMGDGLWIANLNAPQQTVLAGTNEAIERAIAQLTTAGISARRIPVACAFHSPLIQEAQREFSALLARTGMRAPRVPVFSNALAAPYPSSADGIRDVLSEHLVRPVRFVDEIRAMHEAGARVFVEVGPRQVLSKLARESLASRDALIVPLDAPDKPGIVQLLNTLAQLFVAGVGVNQQALAQGRQAGSARLEEVASAGPSIGSHMWMVSGGRARRVTQPAASKDTVKPAEPEPTPVPALSASADPALTAIAPASLAPEVLPVSTVTLTSNTFRSSNGGFMDSPARVHPAEAHEEVMRQFQHLMSQFLQTQAMVMTAYLQGATTHAPASLSLHPIAQSPRAADPGLPAPLPAPAPPPVRVETVQPPAAPVPATPVQRAVTVPAPKPVPEPAPVVAAAVILPSPVMNGNGKRSQAPADVLKQLVSIVSERTGYPEDMLDVNANMEADLGIDSIKRMEVLTAFQQLHGDQARGTFQQAMEQLTALKTLHEMAASLTDLVNQHTEAAVA